MNNTINIFLASSAELKDDRLALENFIGRKINFCQQEGTFIHLDIWEDFIDAVSQTRLQDEYNKKIQSADIFIMLFFTKVGCTLQKNLIKHWSNLKKLINLLSILTLKMQHNRIDSLKRKDAKQSMGFPGQLNALGHFRTDYKTKQNLSCILANNWTSFLQKAF
jgi:hypothetical protein